MLLTFSTVNLEKKTEMLVKLQPCLSNIDEVKFPLLVKLYRT